MSAFSQLLHDEALRTKRDLKKASCKRSEPLPEKLLPGMRIPRARISRFVTRRRKILAAQIQSCIDEGRLDDLRSLAASSIDERIYCVDGPLVGIVKSADEFSYQERIIPDFRDIRISPEAAPILARFLSPSDVGQSYIRGNLTPAAIMAIADARAIDGGGRGEQFPRDAIVEQLANWVYNCPHDKKWGLIEPLTAWLDRTPSRWGNLAFRFAQWHSVAPPSTLPSEPFVAWVAARDPHQHNWRDLGQSCANAFMGDRSGADRAVLLLPYVAKIAQQNRHAELGLLRGCADMIGRDLHAYQHLKSALKQSGFDLTAARFAVDEPYQDRYGFRPATMVDYVQTPGFSGNVSYGAPTSPVFDLAATQSRNGCLVTLLAADHEIFQAATEETRQQALFTVLSYSENIPRTWLLFTVRLLDAGTRLTEEQLADLSRSAPEQAAVYDAHMQQQRTRARP